MNTVLASCCLCQRLVEHRKSIQQCYPDYYCKPVDSFGDEDPGVLIVGLAPGLHGANATGRPFTGDASGDLLFQTLFKFGFASLPSSRSSNDGMKLIQCRLTNAVKCLPPQNKPLGSEVTRCNPYLREELRVLKKHTVILALGRLAHKAILKALGYKQSEFPFAHLREHAFDNGLNLIDSYHCSRYNIQTRRLTAVMFESVFARIRERISDG